MRFGARPTTGHAANLVAASSLGQPGQHVQDFPRTKFKKDETRSLGLPGDGNLPRQFIGGQPLR